MPHPPHAFSSPAPRRLRFVRALAFLWLLGGLLWSWNQAHASPVDSAMVLFMVEAEADAAQETAAGPGVDEGCRKLVPLKPIVADLPFHEADQAVRLQWQIGPVLTQAAPLPAPQHILPEAGQQPLLRPPAALG